MKTRAPYGTRLAHPRTPLVGALVFKRRALAFRVRGLRGAPATVAAPALDRFTEHARDLLGAAPRLQ